MKKSIVASIAVIALMTSCGLIKKTIRMNEVVTVKEQLQAEKNPAKKYTIKQDLAKRKIRIKNVVVKDITESANIDYDFCVIVDVSTNKGMVECFVYTANVKKLSKLVKGKTRVDISGDFGRFFTLLDNYDTRLEIINAKIKIIK